MPMYFDTGTCPWLLSYYMASLPRSDEHHQLMKAHRSLTRPISRRRPRSVGGAWTNGKWVDLVGLTTAADRSNGGHGAHEEKIPAVPDERRRLQVGQVEVHDVTIPRK